MKKFRNLFVAASLLLLTVGVFAGSPKLTFTLYVDNSGTFVPIVSGATFVNIQTAVNGSPVTITGKTGTSYNLLSTNNSSALVYSSGSF